MNILKLNFSMLIMKDGNWGEARRLEIFAPSPPFYTRAHSCNREREAQLLAHHCSRPIPSEQVYLSVSGPKEGKKNFQLDLKI
jgi:hypothetical protein